VGRIVGNRFTTASGKVKRTQRYPQYTDDELKPWFDEIAKGYCWMQATDHCGYSRDIMQNTMYSDDDILHHMLDLAMQAGALIRAGKLPIPDRYDKLYEVTT